MDALDRIPDITRRLAIALTLGLALLTRADAGTVSLMGAGPGAAGSACADPNWSSVVLLAFNDNAATGTTTFVDQSPSAHTLSLSGGTGTAYSNASAPTGLTTSVSFTGFSQIVAADSADWFYGTGDFTMELWERSDGIGVVMAQWTVASQGWSFLRTTFSGERFQPIVRPDYSAIGSSAWPVVNGQWYHLVIMRSGGTFYAFIDGVLHSSQASANPADHSTSPLSFYGTSNPGEFPPNLYVGSARITKGVARYSPGGFTPPSLPLPHC